MAKADLKFQTDAFKALGYTTREIREARRLTVEWKKANNNLMDFIESMASKLSMRAVRDKWIGTVTFGEFRKGKDGGHFEVKKASLKKLNRRKS